MVLDDDLQCGVRVIKKGEDSRFEGIIVSKFTKRDNVTVRFVIENDDGILHIASARVLQLSTNDGAKPCLK